MSFKIELNGLEAYRLKEALYEYKRSNERMFGGTAHAQYWENINNQVDMLIFKIEREQHAENA